MKSASKCEFCGRPFEMKRIPGVPFPIRVECNCEGAREAERAERVRTVKGYLTKAWRSTMVPKRYRSVSEDKAMLESLGEGLYLFGPKGTGKTQTACGVLKAYVRREQNEGYVSARFLSVPDWFASMRGWDTEARGYGQAARCKLLVLDDIGKGKPTEWAMERLFRLVDERYNEMRPTIYTSQYSLAELGARLGSEGDRETAEAIVSRITETCRPMHLDGPDLRLGKR